MKLSPPPTKWTFPFNPTKLVFSSLQSIKKTLCGGDLCDLLSTAKPIVGFSRNSIQEFLKRVVKNSASCVKIGSVSHSLHKGLSEFIPSFPNFLTEVQGIPTSCHSETASLVKTGCKKKMPYWISPVFSIFFFRPIRVKSAQKTRVTTQLRKHGTKIRTASLSRYKIGFHTLRNLVRLSPAPPTADILITVHT